MNNPEELQDEIWVPVRTPWRKRKRFWVIASITAAILLVIGLSSALWLQRQLNPAGPEGESILIDVPNGASINDISEILASKGIVSNYTVTRLWLRNSGPYSPGTYSFRTNMSVPAVRRVLNSGPIGSLNIITLPEGLWAADIEKRLLNNFPLYDAAELDAAIRGNQVRSKYQPADITSLEGLLFPATYEVSDIAIANEFSLIQRMAQKFDSVADGLNYSEAQARIGLTPYQVIIVASMVEAEARVPEDRAKIARVIYNRINNDMRLDIDATVIYAHGEHKSQLTFEDLQIDSPYNTRRFKGLPPTPISMPGEAALRAALNPAEGNWIYYVLAEESGAHFFTDDFDEFNRQAAISREKGLFR